MCLAVPAKVVAIKDKLAAVEVDGIRRTASLMLLPDVKIGDYVMVHAGFAMERVDERSAAEAAALWQEMLGRLAEKTERPETTK